MYKGPVLKFMVYLLCDKVVLCIADRKVGTVKDLLQ